MFGFFSRGRNGSSSDTDDICDRRTEIGASVNSVKVVQALVDKHVEYSISVRRSDEWTISKRYSKFVALHKKTKFMRRSFDPMYIESKRAALHGYLRALLATPGVRDSPALAAFLGSPIVEGRASAHSGTPQEQQREQPQRRRELSRDSPSPAASAGSGRPERGGSTDSVAGTEEVGTGERVLERREFSGGSFHTPLPATSDDGRTPRAALDLEGALAASQARRVEATPRSAPPQHRLQGGAPSADRAVRALSAKQRVSFRAYEDAADLRAAVQSGLALLYFEQAGAELSVRVDPGGSGRRGAALIVRGDAVVNGHRLRVQARVGTDTLRGEGEVAPEERQRAP